MEVHGDPVAAWASIVEDPDQAKAYKQARGKGGHVRVTWPDATKLISAQLIYTIRKYGPDRIAGFTPIPAMSMISYASGARFISLVIKPMKVGIIEIIGSVQFLGIGMMVLSS